MNNSQKILKMISGFIEAGLETMKTTVTIFIIIAGAKNFWESNFTL